MSDMAKAKTTKGKPNPTKMRTPRKQRATGKGPVSSVAPRIAKGVSSAVSAVSTTSALPNTASLAASVDDDAWETVSVERMSYGADAIGHLQNGKTVFIAGAVAGDIAKVQVTSEKARFAQAVARQIEAPSPARVDASAIPCPAATSGQCAVSAGRAAMRETLAGEYESGGGSACYAVAAPCGGCPWAALEYSAQLAAKRANVVDALVRVGRIDRDRAEMLTRDCIASKRTWGYRNKLELGCGADATGRLLLGLHDSETSEVTPISACSLACKSIASTPKALQGALRYVGGTRELGLFRVGIRGSVRTKDMEVALWTEPGDFPRAEVARVLKSAIRATSVVRVIADPGKARKVKKVEVLAGKGLWEEELQWNPAGYASGSGNGGCMANAAAEGREQARFLTSAPSFFQVNTAQAETLVECALGALQQDGFGLDGALVADLYAGGGTFSIPLARAGADVIAVEATGSSVRDLRRNAEVNRVFVEVVGGDTARELPELGELDALVVDPPRAGLAPGVVDSIAAAGPQRVVYVSCDPQTLARDAAIFEQAGYRIASAQPVDLFPQTYHVETVALFEQRRR